VKWHQKSHINGAPPVLPPSYDALHIRFQIYGIGNNFTMVVKEIHTEYRVSIGFSAAVHSFNTFQYQ
jgi:hypothetical protein